MISGCGKVKKLEIFIPLIELLILNSKLAHGSMLSFLRSLFAQFIVSASQVIKLKNRVLPENVWLHTFWSTSPIFRGFCSDTTSIIDTNCILKQNCLLCVFQSFVVHCMKSRENLWQWKKKLTKDNSFSLLEKHESQNILRNNFRLSSFLLSGVWLRIFQNIKRKYYVTFQ